MYLKLSRLLEKIAFILRSKAIYYELKHYIKRNQTYLKEVRYLDRGIGKTYSLIKLASKFKCPIAVPHEKTRRHIESMCEDLHINNIQIISCNESIRGKRYDIILCEEGINIEFINGVLKPMCKCVVGFVGVDDLYYKNNFPQEYECSWIK